MKNEQESIKIKQSGEDHVSHKPHFPDTSGDMLPTLGGKEPLWQMLEHSPSQATQWSLPGSFALSWFAATVTSPATSCPSLLQAEITSIVTADTTRMGEKGKGLHASGNGELFSVISTPLWEIISLPSMLYPSLYPQPFPCDFVPPCKGAQFFSCSLTMGSTTGLALDNTMMWKSRCVSSKSRPQEVFHVFHSLTTLLPPPWKWHAWVSCYSLGESKSHMEQSCPRRA